MPTRHLIRTGAVGLTCVAVGAGASIIGSASGATPSSATASHRAAAHAAGHGGLRALRRAVHAQVVVPVKGGTFATVTYDRGVVQSVSGDQLTLREGTPQSTYGSVTLTIGADATVRLDRQTSSLGALQAGDRVAVIVGPKKTRVIASDATTNSTTSTTSRTATS
jgi:hypothetical protein